ncbi:Rubredoxin [Bienertia sinuspersici]
MASAITRPTTFSFHHSSPSPPNPRNHFISSTVPSKTQKFSSINNSSNRLNFTPKSVDVSKEDKPISEQPNSEESTSSDYSETFDKKRLEEKFAVLNTGIYECRSCGYRYDEAAGDPSYPVPAGMPFGQLPEDWRCPTCGAAKSFFESKSVEIAGFAQNQQFGLGGNSLTSGQKALVIYGSLFLFFCLFLSGYFLQ